VKLLALGLCGASVATLLYACRPQQPPNFAAKAEELQARADKFNFGKDTKSGIQQDVQQVTDAVATHRDMLAMQTLQAAWLDIGPLLYTATTTAGGKLDQATFDAKWARYGTQLASDEASLSIPKSEPLLAQALSEQAQIQARPYYESAKLYAEQTKPEAGLYYIGIAQAGMDFTRYVNGLHLSASGDQPSLRDITPELDELDRRILKKYATASDEDMDGYIPVNVLLKQAREMNAKGWLAGATLAYLQAELQFDASSKTEMDPAAIKDSLSQALGSLNSATDNSIPSLFIQQAQTELAKGGDGANAAAEIVEHVLPHYGALLRPTTLPVTVLDPNKKRVKITLVRWPYT
jgi:hypothetical protein